MPMTKNFDKTKTHIPHPLIGIDNADIHDGDQSVSRGILLEWKLGIVAQRK